jgi:hypothetical protein
MDNTSIYVIFLFLFPSLLFLLLFSRLGLAPNPIAKGANEQASLVPLVQPADDEGEGEGNQSEDPFRHSEHTDNGG